MYVIAASPLAKIFQPKYHKQLLEKPELVYDEDMPFDIVVEKTMGNLHFKYKQPKLISALKKDETDYQFMYQWLTGGEDQKMHMDTACYGLVRFDGEETHELMGHLSRLIAMDGKTDSGKAKKKQLEDSLIPDIKKALSTYKEAADARVMQAIEQVYRGMTSEFEKMKEQSMQPFKPSATEWLCTFVMASPAKSEASFQAKLNQQFRQHQDQMRHV